ncbi:hypothetical protein MLD38_034101 [Melastoma candidum]|uniref:Uncharacterized protein n=1 Tax=Melastoma candidum TaxID=119954 RepID=A0ACB9M9H4_9MYRT|nr:hypothetical protein MLD38_034101 [Melastoma candidum]
MARTMMLENEVAKNLWAEAISTTCYNSNRVHLRHSIGKTPYELYKGRMPNISYFHPFGSKYYILRPIRDGVGKFDARSDEGIFLGYFFTSKAYRVFNKRSLVVEESINVKIDDSQTEEEDADEKASRSSNIEPTGELQQTHTESNPNENFVAEGQDFPTVNTENSPDVLQDEQLRGLCSLSI